MAPRNKRAVLQFCKMLLKDFLLKLTLIFNFGHICFMSIEWYQLVRQVTLPAPINMQEGAGLPGNTWLTLEAAAFVSSPAFWWWGGPCPAPRECPRLQTWNSILFSMRWSTSPAAQRLCSLWSWVGQEPAKPLAAWGLNRGTSASALH